jgi:hypothetical protein
MTPVKQAPQRSPRAMVLGVVGIVVGIVAVLVLFVILLPGFTEDGGVEWRLGPDRFDAVAAERGARAVDDEGPLLFSDPSGGDRDIYLQHLGATPTEGWLAFDARRPGTGRECTLDWDHDEQQLVDPCDGTIVPADGAGLTHYAVEVTDRGRVVVDFRADGATGAQR